MPSDYEFTLDSVEEFLAECEKPHQYDDGRRGSSITGDKDFTGTASYEDALHELRHGWREGSMQMRELHAKVWDTVSRILPGEAINHDVSGFAVDVGRAVNGEPEDMLCFDLQEAPRKTIDIMLNCSVSGGVNKSRIIRRGAAVAALVDAMESQGVNVNLTVVENCRGSGGATTQINVHVKKPEEPLDMDKVAFALAHPSWLRRFVFAFQERQPKKYRDTFGAYENSGYGIPNEVPVEDRGEAIYIGKMHLDEFGDKSDEEVIEWVKEELVKQGVELNE